MRGGRGGGMRSGPARTRVGAPGRCAAGIAVLTTLLLGAGGAALRAQEPGELPAPSLALVGGLFQRLDYHGEGGASLFGFRVRFPLGRHVVVEPGVQYTSFDRDPPEDADVDLQLKLLVMDFQLQVQLPLELAGAERLRPWVGVGAGGAVDFRQDRGTDDFLVSTFTAGAGAALDVGSGLTLLLEGRYRTLDELTHEVVEGSLGIGWRL